MKRTLLLLSTLLSTMSFAQDCSDLFISEYVEGWSNNKAIEIYNPTSSPIDLSQYFIARYSNGSSAHTSGSTLSIGVQLIGTVQPYDVHIAVIDRRDSLGSGQTAPVWDDLQLLADEFYCPDYATSYALSFNGNDALILYKGNVANIAGGLEQIIDVFGKVGQDPESIPNNTFGWTTDFPHIGAGVDVTTDHSLIRKSSILKGSLNPVPPFFNPLAEYDSIPAAIYVGMNLEGNWGSLGAHTCNCFVGLDENSKAKVTIYPNPSNGEINIDGVENYSLIEVKNSLGQVIMKVSNNSKSLLTVDLGKHKGVYFVTLVDETGSSNTKKVIIK